MKYVRDGPRLSLYLQQIDVKWSQVLIADFYFWAAGTTEQCSQDGLLKTMLYRVIHRATELLPMVAPREWSHVEPIATRVLQQNLEILEKKRKMRSEFPQPAKLKIQDIVVQVSHEACIQWTRQDLLQTFHDLLVNLHPSTLLFIILDGLDEYRANDQEMEELVELLKQ